MTSQNAVQKVTRSATGAWRFVERIPTRLRLAMKDFHQTQETAKSKGLPTVTERQDELVHFYTRYESLVELLCNASNYGPDSRQEEKYSDLRAWMQTHYPQLRMFVVAYLRYDAHDARQAIDWHGIAGDAFEALFAAPSLEDFLRLDDGEMIWRIERTRNAINLYGEHLRQLAAQERECE